MLDLPTGTVTLLFTDMEGSTRLLQQVGEHYADVLADCRHLLRQMFVQYNGCEVDTQGDAFFVAFARATDAVAAAVAIQRVLAEHAWPEGISVRVRIGLHTGEPRLTADGYIGMDVHHAARIMSAGHGGQILLSQTTRDLVTQHLPACTFLQDLGEHRLKDLQRPSHLFQLSLEGLPTDFPLLKTLDTHPNNLPIQPTPFIGREREVAAVRQLLQRPDVRLVTLSGPGGVGKTRLALHVAAELADDFADGVFVVALAPVNDPTQVGLAIAQALAISEASDRPLSTLLQAFLKEKQVLLLLDNFEQVGEAAVTLAELLAACTRLKIVVTSRMRLHVRAEHEFAVPPLSVPTLKQLPDLKTLSRYEAVALFIERAQATRPDFQLTNANAPAVAAICAHLDGLPLAIELAAARVKHFSPHTLLARLKQGLSVLSGGARDLPARQQTLRGAIAWSYDLLSPEEQKLFRHLAVFVDGWSLEAAEAICMARGGLAEDMLEGMASLVDKSLLRQEEPTAGETRFWMLQTLREFGLEQMARSGELEATHHAHAEYYLRLAEEAQPSLQATEQGRWLARLEQEYENLRAALFWLLEQARGGREQNKQQAEQALRFCTALSWFWSIRVIPLANPKSLLKAIGKEELVWYDRQNVITEAPSAQRRKAMSLKPEGINPVPEETARIAHAAYPKGNRFMQMRDELGTIYQDESFAHLFSHTGQPAEAPWRLALVTIMQFAEGLSDLQAADAVRGRIDWKYALGLELADAGFDASILSEFRTRLVEGHAEEHLLTVMLTLFKERGWLKARGKQRTDSTHVLAKIRAINRLVCVGETLRHTLNCLALVAPEWLLSHSQPEWVDRYGVRMEDSRLPSSEQGRQAWVQSVGQDGVNLLSALFEPEAPSWLAQVPAVEILRRVWVQNYQCSEGQLSWRSAENIPPASLYISSPYDLDAHYSKKRTTSWVGFKVHLTETCEKDSPHLITHVETTTAPVSDDARTAAIHEGLKQKDLLPGQHIVDTGYVDAQLLHSSQQDYGIDLVGPTRPDVKWQAQQKMGFEAAQFHLDWQAEQATCPQGHTSVSWTPAIDNRKHEVIKIKFSMKDCQSCPSRSLCTHSTRYPRRTITVRREQAHHALQQARARAKTEEFKTLYARRAGVEGTISQGVRAMGLRRSRYIGQEKTHLQHLATAAAMNIVRLMRWLDGEPHAQTRHSPFVQFLRPVA